MRVRYTGQPTNIVGHEGFYVSEVNGRQILTAPSSSPCSMFVDRGIDCDQTNNTSRIRLTSATAIPSSNEGFWKVKDFPLILPRNPESIRSMFCVARQEARPPVGPLRTRVDFSRDVLIQRKSLRGCASFLLHLVIG